ncbi:decapping and exoribonuclease protein-like [Styela clava]
MSKDSEFKTLDISGYSSHSKKPKHVTFSKPVEIGVFSIDGQRKFCNNLSQMSYVEDTSRWCKNMDLNDGYKDRFVKRDENVKERLDNLLRWVVSNLHRFKNGNTTKESKSSSLAALPDFILWRGHMTKIMCTPYEYQEGWEMAAQKLGSTIYISEVETLQAEKRRSNSTDREKLMTYWGVRFEKYMTRPDPPHNRNEAKCPRLVPIDQSKIVVNTNEAYCTVMNVQLNSHKIIHSAEVDCCQNPSEGLTPPDNYIELKTSREFSTQKHEDNFHRYKTKKWWAQSFLAGVPQITCGFRDDNGVIVSIRHFKTLDLPRMARQVPHGAWDANVCLDFLNNFFDFVKNVYSGVQEDEKCVFLFSWRAKGDKVICTRYNLPTKHEFLPEWYKISLSYL